MSEAHENELMKNAFLLEERTLDLPGYMHLADDCIDACISAFEADVPAESITFRIFLADPVNKDGYAEFNSDGSMKLMTKDVADAVYAYNRGEMTLSEVKGVIA